MKHEPFVIPEGSTVYCADIEANGLIDIPGGKWPTEVHSLVIRDYWTGELVASCAAFEIHEVGIPLLNHADLVIFHNGTRYDVEVLRDLYPEFTLPDERILDTLVLSQLIFADRNALDKDDPDMPGKLRARHSLKAWGVRLGVLKGDFGMADGGEQDEHAWDAWTPEMQGYCEQDTLVLYHLAHHLLDKQYSRESVELEHGIARLCWQMHVNGIYFNRDKAAELYGELCGIRSAVLAELQVAFPPRWVSAGTFEYKGEMNRWVQSEYGATVRQTKKIAPSRGYHQLTSGTVTKITLQEFNPGSRPQIESRLRAKYGWDPSELTPTERAKLDESILGNLPYPEAQLLARYMLVNKRIGQLAEGNQAWMKLESNGRIHGTIHPNGAYTGRATHTHPNMSQVPGVEEENGEVLHGEAGGWGYECRGLFGVPPGWTLVGTDLSKLEPRVLGHFTTRFDKGAFRHVVLHGDTYVYFQEKAGLPSRKAGKTLQLAYTYGSGNYKLGTLGRPVTATMQHKWAKSKMWEAGKRWAGKYMGGSERAAALWCSGLVLRRELERKIPGIGKLIEALEDRAQDPGYLLGLDGRRIYVRKSHAILNTLCQSGGGLVAKKWLLIYDGMLRDMGLTHGWDGDYAFLLWSHDEAQVAFRTPELAETGAELSLHAAAEAGQYFGLRVPIAGEAKIGHNWAETH